MNHPLHLAIAEFLSAIHLPAHCKLLLAPECGGTHNLPLFCCDQKSSDAEYCNVDALVVKNSRVCFILEIEESGLIPTKVAGKFLTSALSTHFIHNILNNAATPMGDQVTFVQVLDATKLQPTTKKFKQGQLLESSIQGVLPLRNSKVSVYRLFFFGGVQGFRSDEQKQDDLRGVYMQACGCQVDQVG